MKRILPWVLAVASGVSLALALPGAGWTFLLLVFPGLLLEAIERSPSGWRRWALGWTAGVAHWVVAVNWVLPVMHDYGGLPLPGAILCLIAMAVILGACWAVTVGLAGLVRPSQRIWLLPCLWIALDSGRQFWPYRFPWNPPAASLAEIPVLLQSLAIWGATGLGWAILSLGAGLWACCRPARRRQGVVAAGIALLLTGVLAWIAPRPTAEGEEVVVAVIQPGTTLEQKWDSESWQEMEERVWELTRSAVNEGAAVVLWPESALPYRVDSDPLYRHVLEAATRELGATIVLNSVGGSQENGYTNSAYVVGADGVSEQRYDKIRLVPFGEFVPFWARMAITESLVREVGRFEAGRSRAPLDAGVPLGMAICYEVVFADLVAAEIREGAELLATLTNDAWYGYSWAPRQHFAQAVLRAVEGRRWLVRAALTGISGFVGPDGKVVSQLDVGEIGFVVAAVTPSTQLTPRVRWGDWWWLLSVLVSLAVLIVGRPKKYRTG
jgi:apolipoprotein N-acyltransferase